MQVDIAAPGMFLNTRWPFGLPGRAPGASGPRQEQVYQDSLVVIMVIA